MADPVIDQADAAVESSSGRVVPLPPSLAPVAEPDRIFTLDVLRGFALLGICMVNMHFFAMPFMIAVGVPDRDRPLADWLAWSFVKVFCEFKFISLFSLLFGVGMVVQMTRAEGTGRSFVPVYLRRLVVLFCFGFVHAFGLWYGDILLIYSGAGFFLLLVRRLSSRVFMTLAIIFLSVSVILIAVFGALQAVFSQFEPQAAIPAQTAPSSMPTESPPDVATTEGSEADSPTGWAAMARGRFDPTSEAWIRGEIAAYKDGPFRDAFVYRAFSYGYAVIGAIFNYGWHVLGMFCLGAAFMKLNFFDPSRRRWHRFLAIAGIGVGLPLEAAGAWVQGVAGGPQGSWMWLLASVSAEVGSVPLCLGYVGVWCLALSSDWMRAVARPIANMGRMALTNYLLQTITATFLMYWWGLGWFNDVTRSQQIVLVLAIYTSELIFSALWLSVFRIGPFEWLWRSLTYLQLQPLWRPPTPR